MTGSTVLQRFKLKRWLHQGEYLVVYSAVDMENGTSVVVKLVKCDVGAAKASHDSETPSF